MKTAGIICEYNPFHSGHAYQISDVRARAEATHIIALMSGNFVQRGDIAVFDKWRRAQAAVLGGADLVIELSTPRAMSSAERFASGAAEVLNALGVVDFLAFGSELGQPEPLARAADILMSPEFSARLKGLLSKGAPYHSACSKAALELGGAEIGRLLEGANNLLGIEYIKALKRLNSNIKLFTTRRSGARHDECQAKGRFASASFIRKRLLDGDSGDALRPFVPEEVYPLYLEAIKKDDALFDIKNLERPILAKLRSASFKELSELFDVSEGIERRLLSAAENAGNLEELYFAAKTKRYPLSRIRRLVLAAFIGLTAALANGPQPYIRVLALNHQGRELLCEIEKTCPLPIITKAVQVQAANESAQLLFAFEDKASDLFALAAKRPPACGMEYTSSPAFIKT